MTVLARLPGSECNPALQVVDTETVKTRSALCHPVTAWLAGCAAAALTAYWAIGLVSLAGGETAPGDFVRTLIRALPGAVGYALLVAFLTSIPMPLLVLVERAAGWRRGISDLLAGAAMGALYAQLFGWPLLDGPRGVAITAFAAFSGGVGGLAYWLAAGRPGHELTIKRPGQGHPVAQLRAD